MKTIKYNERNNLPITHLYYFGEYNTLLQLSKSSLFLFQIIMMQQARCLNCDRQLNEGEKFCSNCGQKTDLHRLSFHEFSNEIIHYTTHADKSIFTLLRDLVVKPGTIGREYIAGKRQKYFKPLNFFFIVAGIVVFMTSSLYNPDNSRSKQMELGAQYIKDPVKNSNSWLCLNEVKK